MIDRVTAGDGRTTMNSTLRDGGANALQHCPLCGNRARVDHEPEHDAYRITCEQCLRYTIVRAVVKEISRARERQLEGLADRLTELSHLAAWGDVEDCRLEIRLDTWESISVAQP